MKKGDISCTFSPTHCDTCHFQPGEKLWLAHEFQNLYDSQALTLNTEDHYIVGYCPRYLIREIFELLRRDFNSVDLSWEKLFG